MSVFDRFRLDGRVALLTGAGRGIGLAMARALADAGCAVAIQDVDGEVARGAVDELVAEGRRAVALVGDIGDAAHVATLVPETVRQFGGLHVLVNNAGIQSRGKFGEWTAEQMEPIFRANLTNTVLLTQSAAEVFKAQRWGRVIFLGSIQGLRPIAPMLPYGISKTATAGLTTAVARELARDGVTANLIAPGWFDTHRNQDQLDDSTRRKASEWIPLGRLGVADDCAGLGLLLCYDAGQYITGQTIYVDGGMSLR